MNRARTTALIAALLLLGACQYRMAIEPLRLQLSTLRLGETDFAELVHAAESLRFQGTAVLAGGQYALPMNDYTAMITDGQTQVTFDLDLAISEVNANRHEQLVVEPNLRSFRVRFDPPIELVGPGRRVSLDGASFDPNTDSQVAVGVRFGRTIAASLATAVVGGPSGADLDPIAEALTRLEIPELVAQLRAGSILQHGESELYLSEAATFTLRNLAVQPPLGRIQADFDANLDLGEGTCIVAAEGRLCTDALHLELHGQYEQDRRGAEDGSVTETLRLSRLDTPSVLSGQGQLQWRGDDASIPVQNIALRLGRYECVETAPAPSRCAYDIHLDAQLGASHAALDGQELAFEGLRIAGARLRHDGDAPDLRLPLLELSAPRLRSPQGTIAFGALSLRNAMGSEWGELGLGSASLIAHAGEVTLGFGDFHLVAELPGDSELRLQGDGRLRFAAEAETLAAAAEGEASPEQQDTANTGATSAPIRPRGLNIEAAISGLRLRNGDEVLLQTGALQSSIVLTEQSIVAEVRTDDALSLTPGSLAGDIAIGELRLGFERIRIAHSAEGTRMATTGLRLSLEAEQLLAGLRPHIPPVLVGAEQRLSPGIQRALDIATPLQDLSRFRSRLEIMGLNHLDLTFDHGRLRLQGDLHTRLKLLADEHRVQVRQCNRQVSQTIKVPCIEDGFPALCDREVEVSLPYPCLEEDQVNTELLDAALALSIDLSAELESNAPADLDDLVVSTQIGRCDGIEVRGISPTLQRMLNLEGMVCEHLTTIRHDVRFGELLPLSDTPLSSARVERFSLTSEAEDVHLELDVDVALASEPPTVEAGAE